MALKDAWYTFLDAMQKELDRLDALGGDAAELSKAVSRLYEEGPEAHGFADAMEEMVKDAEPADVLEWLEDQGFI